MIRSIGLQHRQREGKIVCEFPNRSHYSMSIFTSYREHVLTTFELTNENKSNGIAEIKSAMNQVFK